jgi:hypothetical protein
MRTRSGATDATTDPQPHDVGDQLLHAMTDLLARQRPASAAEALQALRRSYPEIPLAQRIAALRAGPR